MLARKPHPGRPRSIHDGVVAGMAVAIQVNVIIHRIHCRDRLTCRGCPERDLFDASDIAHRRHRKGTSLRIWPRPRFVTDDKSPDLAIKPGRGGGDRPLHGGTCHLDASRSAVDPQVDLGQAGSPAALGTGQPHDRPVREPMSAENLRNCRMSAVAGCIVDGAVCDYRKCCSGGVVGHGESAAFRSVVFARCNVKYARRRRRCRRLRRGSGREGRRSAAR